DVLRLAQHARELVGGLGHDRGGERVAGPEVLVRGGAVQTRAVRHHRDPERLGPSLGQDEPGRLQDPSPVVLEVPAARAGLLGDAQHEENHYRTRPLTSKTLLTLWEPASGRRRGATASSRPAQKKAKPRVSRLSRASASTAAVGSSKEVWRVKRARPSMAES